MWGWANASAPHFCHYQICFYVGVVIFYDIGINYLNLTLGMVWNRKSIRASALT